MTAAIIITVLASIISLVGTAAIQDDKAIESCCDLGFKPSKFSETTHKPKQYRIKNFCGNNRSTITKVYCDTVTDGGGWLVVQRRIDGSENFDRDWSEYEQGFGTLPADDTDTSGEFWLGLYSLNCLTSQGQWEMRIDYKSTNGKTGYLSYSNFRVGSASTKYQLTISGYDGATTDPFYTIYPFNKYATLNGLKFTTKDRDNDEWSGGNCATDEWVGITYGWWYRICSYIRLNGPYKHSHTVYLDNEWYSLLFTEIKIRPRNCIF